MSLKPSEMLCFALYSASQAMQHAYRDVLAEHGLTYPQYLVMTVLWGADEAPSVKDIGDQLHLESSTTTPLLKRLEAAGLVARTRDSEDERRVRIGLTSEGRALKMRAAQVPAEILARTGLSEAALAAMRADLEGLATHLRGAPPGAPAP